MGREAGGAQLLTMVPHVVPQQPLSGKPLGAVRALEALLWGRAGKERVAAEDGGGRGENESQRGEPPRQKGTTPRRQGELRELGRTQYYRRSVGLGMENLS